MRGPMADLSIADRLRAAEPASRPIRDLIARLTAAELFRGARAGGRPIGAAALVDFAITGLSFDSRRVSPGQLFIAVRGEHVDGHEFVESAAARGAVAAVVEQPVAAADVPQLVVRNTQRVEPL